jgi:hypothetical protein
VSDHLILLGLCVSILGSCSVFVLTARLRVHGSHWDALAGARDAANERAIALLKTCLTPEQREDYEKHQFFDVIGSDTGRLYRIKYGTQGNIIEIDKRRGPEDLRLVLLTGGRPRRLRRDAGSEDCAGKQGA